MARFAQSEWGVRYVVKELVTLPQVFQFLAIGMLFAWPASAWAQIVIATVPAGSNPSAIAVNRFVTAPRLDSWLQQHSQKMLSHISEVSGKRWIL